MNAMVFILGFISGQVTVVAIFVILAFLQKSIEPSISRVKSKLNNAGPKPTGAILFPEDDATLARNEYIAKRKKAGLDTPISELQ